MGSQFSPCSRLQSGGAVSFGWLVFVAVGQSLSSGCQFSRSQACSFARGFDFSHRPICGLALYEFGGEFQPSLEYLSNLREPVLAVALFVAVRRSLMSMVRFSCVQVCCLTAGAQI